MANEALPMGILCTESNIHTSVPIRHTLHMHEEFVTGHYCKAQIQKTWILFTRHTCCDNSKRNWIYYFFVLFPFWSQSARASSTIFGLHQYSITYSSHFVLPFPQPSPFQNHSTNAIKHSAIDHIGVLNMRCRCPQITQPSAYSIWNRCGGREVEGKSILTVLLNQREYVDDERERKGQREKKIHK